MTDGKLSKTEIETVKALARDKLVEYRKLNDVIGSQVFSILEKENKVLYYPLEDDQVWGFCEQIQGKSFVCINTSLPYDKQVFAAAHELYHLWYGSSENVMWSEEMEEHACKNVTELLANRFAAEFLVNEELLLQEMRVYDIDKTCLEVKDIVRLANLFVVPYHTMVRRLYEINVLDKKKYQAFKMCTEEQAQIWRNRLGLAMPVRSNKIGLSNLIDRAMELYEKKLITYEKLEYLLEFADLTPVQMGVNKDHDYVQPTDGELDAIMEEEE